VELEEYLPDILYANKIDNLSIDDWALLKECRLLLMPFAQFTDLLAKETEPTMPIVIPAIIKLRDFLLVNELNVNVIG
jgi:hypothetical protein